MIKKLRGILGLGVGPSDYSPTPSVIGAVEQSSSGNAVLRIGKATVTDTDHPSWTQTEYVVLTSGERNELIDTLASQQDYQTIRTGDIVGDSAIVLAVHYVNGRSGNEGKIGTVLGWIDHKMTYVVYTADPYGEVGNATYRTDSTQANNAYIARLTDHHFRHFNSTPPTLTYAHVADLDKLKD